MILCNKDCIPCCDFCLYSVHEKIIIDGKDAKITGGSYQEKTPEVPGSGMQINLQEPSIQWGNGNFQVNEEGNISLIRF